MGIPKRMAVAVSGLVFAGGAALAVGTAAPASGEAMVMAPGQLVSNGCCGGRHNSSWRQNHRNLFRHNQRIIVINRNHNFSRSDTGQFQRQRQQRRNFDEEED